MISNLPRMARRGAESNWEVWLMNTSHASFRYLSTSFKREGGEGRGNKEGKLAEEKRIKGREATEKKSNSNGPLPRGMYL